jgi:phosphoglucomutase
LTGFKFIGEQAMLIENTDQEFFFGYEESYGYVIKDFVRDKDSLQATLLLSEVASYYKSLNKTLVEVLDDIYAEYGYYAEGVENIYLEGLDGSKRIEKIMRTFQGMRISEIAGRKVTIIEDYDQGIKYENNKKSRLTLPKSFVLKYIFEDGGWFVLRPSGTEPKLKIYIAVRGEDKASAYEFVARLKTVLNKMMEAIK